MRDSYGITIQGPVKTPDDPVGGVLTQIFFYLGDGNCVGISGVLPEGVKLEIQAVPQEGFQFWQGNNGELYAAHTLEIEAGFSETLTPYFATVLESK